MALNLLRRLLKESFPLNKTAHNTRVKTKIPTTVTNRDFSQLCFFFSANVISLFC